MMPKKKARKQYKTSTYHRTKAQKKVLESGEDADIMDSYERSAIDAPPIQYHHQGNRI